MTTESMEPFESAANLDEDVGLFEAATHSAVVVLPEPALRTIVAALDGSNQDATSRTYAELLAARTGANVVELAGPTSAAEILAATESHRADLLIVDVPYGQDYGELGGDSLGSVVDLLLLKSPVPVLCVRAVQDREGVQAALDSVIVPVAVADDEVTRALGWAFRVTPEGGRIDLVAVADRDVLSEASHLIADTPDLRTLEPSRLSRALLSEIGGVVAATQKRGAAEGRTVHVETRVGKFVPLTLAELHGRPHVIIWGLTRDHASPAFHRAVDLLLASTGPVLMV